MHNNNIPKESLLMQDTNISNNNAQDINLENLDFIWSILKNNFISKYGSDAFSQTLEKCQITACKAGIIYINAPVLFVQKRLLNEFNIENLILRKIIKVSVGRSNYSKNQDKKNLTSGLNFNKKIAGSPNVFLRGSLFAAIKPNDRKYQKRISVFKAANLELLFTGQQLTQTDRIIWEAIVELVKSTATGQDVLLSASAFLKKIGSSQGRTGYNMLRHSLSRFVACCVEIVSDGYVYADNLLSYECQEGDLEIYKITINPQIVKLYDMGWSVNEKHLKLINTRDALTLWLLGFIGSHSRLYPTKIKTIHTMSGSANNNLRDFKYKLKKSLLTLENIGVVQSWSIADDLVTIQKK